MAHLIGKAELLDRSRGVAAADDRDRVALGDRSGDADRAGRKVFPLGNAHRSVPDDGAGVFHCFSEERGALRADVKTHPAVRNIIGIDDHVFGIFLIFLADDVVDRNQELDALGFGFFHHLFRKVNLVRFEQRGADRVAERGEEGVRHAAADDQGIDLLHQVGDDADLIGDLGAAEDRDEGSLRVFQRAADVFEFLLDQETADSGQIIGNAGGGGVGAMRRAERVVDIDLSKRSELLGKFGVVFGLFRMETDVFEQEDFAFLEIGGKALRAFADDVLRHLDRTAEQFAQTHGNGS